MELGHWFYQLSDREKLSVQHAVDYSNQYAESHITGHSQFMLIAKLVELLNERENVILLTQHKVVVQQIVWDKDNVCWRDILTGVRTEINDRYATVSGGIAGSVEDIKSDNG